MSTALTFKELIDLSIGTPEPGHVNFYALHCLLSSIVTKMGLNSVKVDCCKYKDIPHMMQRRKLTTDLRLPKVYKPIFHSKDAKGFRIAGGADRVDDDEPKPEPIEAAEEEAAPPAEAELSEVEADVEQPPPAEEAPPAEAAAPEPAADEPVDAPLPVEETPAEAPPEPVPVPEPQEASEEPAPAEVPEDRGDGSSDKAAMPMDALVVGARTSLLSTPRESKVSMPAVGAVQSHLTSSDTLVMRLPYEHQKGIAIMKDQLELAMEQLRTLTTMVVDNKTDNERKEKLRRLTRRLRCMQRDNIYIGGAQQLDLSDDQSISVFSQCDECLGEGSMDSDIESKDDKTTDLQLSAHVTYPPEKILDQFLVLKADVCTLTNKVNDVMAAIMQQDCQSTTKILQELQDQVHELRFNTLSLKEVQDKLEARNNDHIWRLEDLDATVKNLSTDKLDKSEIEVLLSSKVDYEQLQRKVSHEQYQELQCRMEKKLRDLNKLVEVNEKNMFGAVENVRSTIGFATVNDILNKFKNKMEAEILALQAKLQTYIDSTDDECAAAGARVKVLQDLACLSCDGQCVMHSLEKTKVGKLPNAHATAILSPLVTYELGSIRKSGLMGYYRKDQFPHAPNAWMQRQTVALKKCVPRHAGGGHTVTTAKDHVEKVISRKKKTT